MKTLKQVLMDRDDLTSEQADLEIENAKQDVRDGENPEDVLMDRFGLEPDYIFDLIEDF